MTNQWQIPKMTVHKKLLHKINSYQPNFNDLGVIIMRTRCSIQQVERITVDQSKVLENRLFRFFGGPPGISQEYHESEIGIMNPKFR